VGFLADGATTLTPVSQASIDDTLETVGSEAGWGRLTVHDDGGAWKSLALERFNQQAELIDRTPLANGNFVSGAGLALRNGEYFAWWTATGGLVMSVSLPTSGPVAGTVEPKQLFDAKTPLLVLVLSNRSFWGLTDKALYEREATHIFDEPRSFPSDLLAFDGAALKVESRFQSNAGIFPGSVAMAEPTTDFTTIANAPSFFDARFSEKSGNRALLLGFEHEYRSELHQRAVVSVIELSGLADEPPSEGGAGAGGDASVGAGGAATTPSEAGAPAAGGSEALPTDGGAATLPTDGGTSSSHAGTTNGGGKPPLGNDASEGGSVDEGDDVTHPSSPSGSHNSKGCGCRATGTDVSGDGTGALLLLGALAVRRRRIIPS
jgi:MYXO-CTERM domain-containing protein